MTVTIMKKTKNLKTRVGIFKNMGGNIPGGNFPGGSLMAGAFGNNTGKEPQKPCPKLKNVYIIYLLRIFALPAIPCKW